MAQFDANAIIKTVRKVLDCPHGRIEMLPARFTKCDADAASTSMLRDADGYHSIVALEEKLCSFTGMRHAVAVSSGTAALKLALLACGIGPGDQVLCPAMTFAGCASAIKQAGAEPHFVDCRFEPLGSINAFKLRQYMAKIPRDHIKAIVGVDFYGHPGIDEDLHKLCAELGLFIIEDAAAAIGMENVGTYADVATISFNRNKLVTTGGGGAVLCHDEETMMRVRHLATTAKEPSRFFYEHKEMGYNDRLQNYVAAVGANQIDHLAELKSEKDAIHSRYAEELVGNTDVYLVKSAGGNNWLNAILIDPRHPMMRCRDILLGALDMDGIGTRAAFTPLHMLPAYADCPRMDNLALAEDIFRRLVALPSRWVS